MRLSFGTSRFSSKGDISQRKGDNNQHIGNNSQIINFDEVHDILLLNMYPRTKENIPLTISAVNISDLDDESIPGNIGEMIATPNQNTEKLIKKSAVTEIKAGSTLFINNKFNIL